MTTEQLRELLDFAEAIESLCIDYGMFLTGSSDGSVYPASLSDDLTLSLNVFTDKLSGRLGFDFLITDLDAPLLRESFAGVFLRGESTE